MLDLDNLYHTDYISVIIIILSFLDDIGAGYGLQNKSRAILLTGCYLYYNLCA